MKKFVNNLPFQGAFFSLFLAPEASPQVEVIQSFELNFLTILLSIT